MGIPKISGNFVSPLTDCVYLGGIQKKSWKRHYTYITFFMISQKMHFFVEVEASSDLRSRNGFKLFITNIWILKVRFFFNEDTPKMTIFKITRNILDKSHELICKLVVQIQKRQEKNKDREKKEGTRGHWYLSVA